MKFLKLTDNLLNDFEIARVFCTASYLLYHTATPSIWQYLIKHIPVNSKNNTFQYTAKSKPRLNISGLITRKVAEQFKLFTINLQYVVIKITLSICRFKGHLFPCQMRVEQRHLVTFWNISGLSTSKSYAMVGQFLSGIRRSEWEQFSPFSGWLGQFVSPRDALFRRRRWAQLRIWRARF